MSRGKMKQRTLYPRAFKQCTNKQNADKIAVFDVDNEELDYVNVDVPGPSHRRSKWSHRQQKAPLVKNFINIDDDEGNVNFDDKNVASDATPRDSHLPSTSSHSFVDVEDDDCQIFFDNGKEPVDLASDLNSTVNSSRLFPSVRRFSVNNSTPRMHFGHSTSESDMYISDSSKEELSETDDSDCEIIDDSSGIESWERAAKRKRKQDPLTDTESNFTASESSDESSVPFCEKTSERHNVEPSSCQKQYADTSNLKYSETVHCAFDAFNKTPSFDPMKSFAACFDDVARQDSNPNPLFSVTDNANCQSNTMHEKDNLYEANLQEEVLRNESLHEPMTAKEKGNLNSSMDAGSGVVNDDLLDMNKISATKVNQVFEQCDASKRDSLDKVSSISTLDVGQSSSMAERALGGRGSINPQSDTGFLDSIPLNENCLIGEREKHKESEEYKRAAEAEWASRQEQLRIQAEEAQRLRKRKKAENLRLLEMEKRQKQRLEEVRETQKKVEETVNLKEKIRAEVRKELARMELLYNDMASLLCALGVSVDGGIFPSSQEVHTAYKRAALKFHPDRASRTDIRQQVEAEEKFKLISRLKEKLLPLTW